MGAKKLYVKACQRAVERKIVDCLEVKAFVETETCELIANKGYIYDVSSEAMLMVVNRKDLVQKKHRSNLTLGDMQKKCISLYLPQMDLGIEGYIQRTQYIGRGQFEIVIRFHEDIPVYWRESLMDLMPAPGEMPD